MKKLLLSIGAIISLGFSGLIFSGEARREDAAMQIAVRAETDRNSAGKVRGDHLEIPGSWQDRCILPVLVKSASGQALHALCRIKNNPSDKASKYATSLVILPDALPEHAQVSAIDGKLRIDSNAFSFVQ